MGFHSSSEEVGHRDQLDRNWFLEQDEVTGAFTVVLEARYNGTAEPAQRWDLAAARAQLPPDVWARCTTEHRRVQADKVEVLGRPSASLWLCEIALAAIDRGDGDLAPGLAELLSAEGGGHGASVRERAERALAKIGADAVDPLLRSLADPRLPHPVRSAIASYLTSVGQRDRALSVLLDLYLRAGEQPPREGLADVVIRVGLREGLVGAILQLATLCRSSIPGAFAVLSGVLAGLESGYDECVNLFTRALASEDVELRKCGCLGLYYLGGRAAAARDLLLPLRGDPDAIVRRMADNAVAAVGRGAAP